MILIILSSIYRFLIEFTIIEVNITSFFSISSSYLLIKKLINYYISTISTLLFTTISYLS